MAKGIMDQEEEAGEVEGTIWVAEEVSRIIMSIMIIRIEEGEEEEVRLVTIITLSLRLGFRKLFD